MTSASNDVTESSRPRPRRRGPFRGARQRTASLAERISVAATEWTGQTSAFTWALILVIGWTATGPIFHYSDTWQLFINTVTNLVTFLMVFLIQRAQNKDTLALQIKVNELIAAHKGAHNSFIGVEQLSEEDLRNLQQRFHRLAEVSRGTTPTSGAAGPAESVPPAGGAGNTARPAAPRTVPAFAD